MKRMFFAAAIAAIVAMILFSVSSTAQTTTPTQQEAAIRQLVKDRDALVAAVKALVKDRDLAFAEIAALKKSGGSGGTTSGLTKADVIQLIKKHAVELNGKTLAELKARLTATENELKILKAQKVPTAKEVTDVLVKDHLTEIRGPQGPVGFGRDGKDAVAPVAPTADEVAKRLASQVIGPVAAELVKNFKDQLPAGKDGKPGENGLNGRDGADGRDGEDADPSLVARALIFSADVKPGAAFEKKLLWKEGTVGGVFCQALVFEDHFLLDWLRQNILKADGSFDQKEAAKWLRKRLPEPLAKDISSKL